MLISTQASAVSEASHHREWSSLCWFLDEVLVGVLWRFRLWLSDMRVWFQAAEGVRTGELPRWLVEKKTRPVSRILLLEVVSFPFQEGCIMHPSAVCYCAVKSFSISTSLLRISPEQSAICFSSSACVCAAWTRRKPTFSSSLQKSQVLILNYSSGTRQILLSSWSFPEVNEKSAFDSLWSRITEMTGEVYF